MPPLAQDLFAQARELPTAERDAFLAQACGDDAELRLEVQRLLVDSARADSFFGDADGSTLGAEAFRETFSEKPGDTIGPHMPRGTKDHAMATCPVWTEFGLAWP